MIFHKEPPEVISECPSDNCYCTWTIPAVEAFLNFFFLPRARHKSWGCPLEFNLARRSMFAHTLIFMKIDFHSPMRKPTINISHFHYVRSKLCNNPINIWCSVLTIWHRHSVATSFFFFHSRRMLLTLHIYVLLRCRPLWTCNNLFFEYTSTPASEHMTQKSKIFSLFQKLHLLSKQPTNALQAYLTKIRNCSTCSSLLQEEIRMSSMNTIAHLSKCSRIIHKLQEC